MPEIFTATQSGVLGRTVNGAGYKKSHKLVDVAGSNVLEIGPGYLDHIRYWKGTPNKVTLVDRRPEFLEIGKQKLEARGIPFECIVSEPGGGPLQSLEDAQFDIVFAFYVLEHITPLAPTLLEIRRVLKPTGALVGAIPAEGGLAWGLGRFLTTRRWFRKHTSIDLDKIICWEHPNFADEVVNKLDQTWPSVEVYSWPFGIPNADLSLVHSFVCRSDRI